MGIALPVVLCLAAAGCFGGDGGGMYPDKFTFAENELYGDLRLVDGASQNADPPWYLGDDYRMDSNPGWATAEWAEDFPRSMRPVRHYVSIYERASIPSDVLVIDGLEFADDDAAARWTESMCQEVQGGDAGGWLLLTGQYAAILHITNEDYEGFDRDYDDMYEIREWGENLAIDLAHRLGTQPGCGS